MSDTSIETQLSFANSELTKRIGLLEEKLLETESAGNALQNSEKRYRRLFEAAQDGILILDADTGHVVDVNPYLLRLLGYSYDELCGQHIWDIGVFKDLAASLHAFKTLQDNEYIRYEDLPLETLSGKPIAVEFVSNIYQVDNTKVIQCNIRDITERKLAKRALEESEAKTRSILDNIGIGVALIGPGMEVLELNHQMREWFPTVDPARHCSCYRVFNDPQRNEMCDNCPTYKTLHDGKVHEGLMQMSRPGVMRSCRIVSSPILNASGGVTAAIEMVEDITEKLSLESQFRQSQKMEAVGRLAGGVAHDFNNMLSVILGYAEMALDKVDPAQPLHGDLQAIQDAARRSAAITRQLLAFARKQTINPKVLDLNVTVAGMLKMLRRLIGEDIHLVWRPESGLWQVKMDPSQVEQILANLSVNARDAIAGVGKVTVKTANAVLDEAYCVEHAGCVAGEYAVLVLSDDGCGMDEETLDKIFEPFFTTKALGQGTGLGLATVYGIVKQNSGFINVYSEQGKGTTFRIYLARHAGEPVKIHKESDGALPRSRGETVLVVEDEISLLKLASGMLLGLGYAVLTAGTPNAAMHLVEKCTEKIHLLMTDVILPEMNGRDLAARIKKIIPAVKCLFMSGYTADVIVLRGMLAEGAQFIPKPFSLSELAVKVREVLREN